MIEVAPEFMLLVALFVGVLVASGGGGSHSRGGYQPSREADDELGPPPQYSTVVQDPDECSEKRPDRQEERDDE